MIKVAVVKGKDEDIEWKINQWLNRDKDILNISMSNNGCFPCIYACILFNQQPAGGEG